jgi:hypothetical protein
MNIGKESVLPDSSVEEDVTPVQAMEITNGETTHVGNETIYPGKVDLETLEETSILDKSILADFDRIDIPAPALV